LKFNLLFYFSVVSLNEIVQNIPHQLKMISILMKINIIYHHLIKLEDFHYKVIVMKYPAMIMKWWFKIRSIVYLSLYHNIHLILFNNNNNELNSPINYNHKSYNHFFLLFKKQYIYLCQSLLVFFIYLFFFDVRITIINKKKVCILYHVCMFVDKMQSSLHYLSCTYACLK